MQECRNLQLVSCCPPSFRHCFNCWETDAPCVWVWRQAQTALRPRLPREKDSCQAQAHKSLKRIGGFRNKEQLSWNHWPHHGLLTVTKSSMLPLKVKGLLRRILQRDDSLRVQRRTSEQCQSHNPSLTILWIGYSTEENRHSLNAFNNQKTIKLDNKTNSLLGTGQPVQEAALFTWVSAFLNMTWNVNLASSDELLVTSAWVILVTIARTISQKVLELIV